MSEPKKRSFETFRGYCSVVLSIMLGMLITLPLTTDTNRYLPLLGAAAGLLVGLRRKSSHAYFYFVLVGCAVMSTVLLTQMDFVVG